MSTSVLTRRDVSYPGPEEFFSPSERYPEYPYDDLATRDNAVYPMVREVLAQAGLDRERFGTPEWNPLGRFIEPGASVFVLCNFVYHRRPQETVEQFFGKCTHGSVLRALLDYVLLAAGPRGRVRFGNSPLQSCNWKKVLSDSGADRVVDFYRRREAPVEATDLRLYVAERGGLGNVVRIEQRDAATLAVDIDLGKQSLLDELAGDSGRAPEFRISDYDPRRIAAFHSGGSHHYVVGRPVLEADVVLSLPKMKTHEKVGITCALKGYVGMVGHKDCLAHHRFGGPSTGDEFPRGSWILTPAARYHDWLNRRGQAAPLQGSLQVLDRVVRKALRSAGYVSGGAWHGNDTAWRMTLDLVRIAHYADRDGTMRDEVQRRNIVLLDGIVAGEGQGPLSPEPARARTLLFSDDVAEGDRIACRLMGYDPGAIRIVHEACTRRERPPSGRGGADRELIYNGGRIGEEALRPVLGRPFRPPRGWREHLEA